VAGSGTAGPAKAYRNCAIPGSVPAGSGPFPAIESTTLVIGVVELAANSAPVLPSRLFVIVPNRLAPLKNVAETGKKPCENASGSASNPKTVRGVENDKVTDVTFRKSSGDKTFGVLVSTAGGVPQGPQLPSATEKTSKSDEKVMVRLGSESEVNWVPTGPGIGRRVVEPTYAAFGSAIGTNVAFAEGTKPNRPTNAAIVETLKSLAVKIAPFDDTNPYTNSRGRSFAHVLL
jgi:hypothetical protein